MQEVLLQHRRRRLSAVDEGRFSTPVRPVLSSTCAACSGPALLLLLLLLLHQRHNGFGYLTLRVRASHSLCVACGRTQPNSCHWTSHVMFSSITSVVWSVSCVALLEQSAKANSSLHCTPLVASCTTVMLCQLCRPAGDCQAQAARH
jgi:hypothetical protein